MKSSNIPEVKLGIIAVSRDCFPIALSEKRRAAISAACAAKGTDLYECKTTVENEHDMQKAVAEVTAAGCNALTVFLGNFGPETPETLIAKHFDGPCMFVAAAEGDGRYDQWAGGDAYCGMLNCSYNLGMRHPEGLYSPSIPVGTADGNCRQDRRVCADCPYHCSGVREFENHHLGRARRTSSPAMPPSRACMSWVLRSRKTPSLTCSFPTKSMRATRASRTSARTWPPRWARGTITPTC